MVNSPVAEFSWKKQHVCVNLSNKNCGLTNRNDDLANKHGYFSWLLYIYIYIFIYTWTFHIPKYLRLFALWPSFRQNDPKTAKQGRKGRRGRSGVKWHNHAHSVCESYFPWERPPNKGFQCPIWVWWLKNDPVILSPLVEVPSLHPVS